MIFPERQLEEARRDDSTVQVIGLSIKTDERRIYEFIKSVSHILNIYKNNSMTVEKLEILELSETLEQASQRGILFCYIGLIIVLPILSFIILIL